MANDSNSAPIFRPKGIWKSLNVGLIQTSLDHESAWGKVGPPMSPLEQTLAWEEIQRCLRSFRSCEPRPHLVLIPELSVPRGRLNDLRRASGALGSLIVAGVDYRLDYVKRTACNEAVVLIPTGWMKQEPSRAVSMMTVGKTYPAEREAALLKTARWKYEYSPNFWIFEGGEAGRFGLSICYDFLDLERALMYKEQIQHLAVVAYNRDVDSFRYMAESLARTVYCNVVICNTGHFGGSLAITPYYHPWERTVYRHNGSRMLTSQVIQLPVQPLITAQAGKARPKTFKSLPPGWSRTQPGKLRLILNEKDMD
jgi:predicted amidohydrolase